MRRNTGKTILNYIARTIPENACNAKPGEIQGYADELKQDPEVKEGFMSFQDYLMAERQEAVLEAVKEVETALEQAEAERDAQTERAAAAEAERDAQTKRAKIAEAQRDMLFMEIEKLRDELARLQEQVQ